MTVEALNGIIDTFDERIHLARGYPEQIAVAKRMRKWLEGSRLTSRQVNTTDRNRCIDKNKDDKKKKKSIIKWQRGKKGMANKGNELNFEVCKSKFSPCKGVCGYFSNRPN